MRKIFNIILYLLFIVICLFLIGGSSSAEVYTTGFSSSEISQIESVWADYNNNFDTYTAFRDSNDYLLVNIFNRPADFKVQRLNQSNYFYSNLPVIGTGYWIKVYPNNTRQVNTFTGATSNYTNSRNINGISYYYLYGNIPIYNNDGTSYLWAPEVNTPASIVNFSTQAYLDNLIDGSFEYILVSSGSYAQYPLRLWINNGSTSDDTIKGKYINLDHNSPYADISIEPNQYQSYTIPKIDLIPIYNNSIYNMWLEYGENYSISTPIQTFTTNFSQATIDNAVVDEQDSTQKTAENTEKIANELNQTNQFLNSDSVDDSDIELPEISVSDFTLSFFSDLIGGLTDAFLNTSYDEYIEFDVRDTHYIIHSTEFNILGRVGLSVLKNFVSLFWIFGIGYWIYCDARRRIALMKEFHWTAMFADDISVDML